MASSLDPRMLSMLQPKAQQMRERAALSYAGRQSVRLNRKQQKAREAAVIQQLWTEAHQQGLTSFAVPPILVSLLCRALWAVIMHFAEQILSGYEGGLEVRG